MSPPVVLLIEDNSSDEELVRRALRKQRVEHELVVVRDGVEAFDYVTGQGSFATRDPEALPKLVLLDLKLPKLSGLELLRRLRADLKTRTIPIVVFTSSSEESDIDASYDLGCNSFVCKPVASSELNDAIRELMAYWLTLNVTPMLSPGIARIPSQHAGHAQPD